MEESIKQLIESSLEEYEGKKIKIIVNFGSEYYDKKEVRDNIKEIFSKGVEDSKDFYIKDIEDIEYKIDILQTVELEKDSIIYKINIIKIAKDNEKKNKSNFKNKYEKQIYIENKINKYIQSIGIVDAQKAHAEDIIVDRYILLRDFLKANSGEFSEIKLYVKDDNNFNMLRHKNLFSKYKDEISDFEKITYFERIENKMLQLRHKLDDNILEFDQSKMGLLDRKNARFFAKEIYEKKGIFTDKELLRSLKGQNMYIKIEEVLSRDNKLVWSQIKTENMNIRTLEKAFKNEYKNKKERVKNIELKYLNKRDKKRKKRRLQKYFIKEGLIEYNIYVE